MTSAQKKVDARPVPEMPKITDADLCVTTIKQYFVKAPPGATVEDLSNPAFWRRTASQLTRHFRLIVVADLEDWEAEVIIERVAPGEGCDVTIVRHTKRLGIDASEKAVDHAHVLRWEGGVGFGVFRKSDGQRIVGGHQSPQGAEQQFFRQQPRQV